jgi:hypothetical protein
VDHSLGALWIETAQHNFHHHYAANIVHNKDREAKQTLKTNPIVAYGIVLRCGRQPPPLDYHTGSCSPTLNNKEKNCKSSFCKEKGNTQLMSLFVKTTENILKAGGVHAHHKLKYSLTRGLNHSNSLHCSATASCKVINILELLKNAETILASDKAPVSSRENLGRASLIRYSRIVSTSPIVQ